MTSTLSRVMKSPVYRIVVAQFIATLIATALSLVLGQMSAVSALLAGIVCIVPGLYVLGMTLRPLAPGSTGISLILRGEVGKLTLTVVLFAVIFLKVKSLDVMVFFSTLVFLQLCNILVPVIDARRLLRR